MTVLNGWLAREDVRIVWRSTWLCGKIQLPLTKSYVLLSELLDQPLSKIYHQEAAKIQNALQIRNYSLFVHGFEPITKENYREFSGVVGFI